MFLWSSVGLGIPLVLVACVLCMPCSSAPACFRNVQTAIRRCVTRFDFKCARGCGCGCCTRVLRVRDRRLCLAACHSTTRISFSAAALQRSQCAHPRTFRVRRRVNGAPGCAPLSRNPMTTRVSLCQRWKTRTWWKCGGSQSRCMVCVSRVRRVRSSRTTVSVVLPVGGLVSLSVMLLWWITAFNNALDAYDPLSKPVVTGSAGPVRTSAILGHDGMCLRFGYV